MTTYTLFSQAAESGTVSGAGNGGTNGVHFTVSAACTLQGAWHYSPSGQTQLPVTIALYTTQASPATGTLVTSNTATWLTGPGGSAASAGSGWCYAAFTSPPSLSSGTNYMAVQFRNDAVNGWFAYTDPYTFPASSGIITAPDDVSTGQGWYNTGTALAFPSSQDAGTNWWLDVQVTAGTARTVTASLTVTPGRVAGRSRISNYGTPVLDSAGNNILDSAGIQVLDTRGSASAALAVTPSRSAAAARGHYRTTSATVTPSRSATASRTAAARTATASLTAVPSRTATAARGRYRSAPLTVTPSLAASRAQVHARAAALAATPRRSRRQQPGRTTARRR